MQKGNFQLGISHIMLLVHWPCPFILLTSRPASVLQRPTCAPSVRVILFISSILSSPPRQKQKPFTIIMSFAKWILGIIKTPLSIILQNPLSLTWKHQLLGFSHLSSCMCVILSHLLGYKHSPKQCLQEGKKHFWGSTLKSSIFFVPLFSGLQRVNMTMMESGRKVNLNYKNKPLCTFSRTPET